MSKTREGGFAGILFLIIATVAVGGIIYYIKENARTNNYVPTDTSSVDQGALAYGSLVDNTATSTATTTIVMNKEEISANSEAEKSVAKKKTSLAIADSTTSPPPIITTPKPTPKPVVEPEPVLEPQLLVTEGERLRPTLLLWYAYGVPFTIVRLTAVKTDVEITGLTIERTGVASDRIFTEIGIEGIDSERTPNSKHQYVTHETFTVKAGETREIVLFGNVADHDTLAELEGQTPSISLVGIETTTKITGQLPIVGTTHTVNSTLNIGTLEISSSGYDPGSGRTLYINSTNVIFSGLRVNAGSEEPVLLKYFAFTQNGSASMYDLANVQICVSNKGVVTCYDAIVDTDGKVYYVELEDEVKIEKGESIEIYIKGDVGTTGSNRTIDFDMTSATDSMAYGLTYKNYILGYGGELDGVQPEGSFSTSEYPFYNAYAHTISAGSFNSIGR